MGAGLATRQNPVLAACVSSSRPPCGQKSEKPSGGGPASKGVGRVLQDRVPGFGELHRVALKAALQCAPMDRERRTAKPSRKVRDLLRQHEDGHGRWHGHGRRWRYSGGFGGPAWNGCGCATRWRGRDHYLGFRCRALPWGLLAVNWFEEAYKLETRKQKVYIAIVVALPVVTLTLWLLNVL